MESPRQIRNQLGKITHSIKTDEVEAIISNVPKSLRDLETPYRMAKLNRLWTKAKEHGLPDSKLQSLFSDLKIHDKEEIALKHLKADGGDEDGLEENRMRKKLMGIMSTYGLLKHFADTGHSKLPKHHKPLNDGSNYVAKDIFDDQRLNMLWAKAERAGFDSDELQALKEEFTHHQNKVDEYKSLLEDVKAGDPEKYKNSLDEEHESWNEIDHKEESNAIPEKKKLDFISKANLLREKIVEIKSGYDHLEEQTSRGPNHKEFTERKVQDLWATAQKAKFSKDELESLKEELHHYETRLRKLHHLHTEAALEAARNGKTYDLDNSTDHHKIKKHARSVEKLHIDIETRILQKHTDL
ncbi:alpha-2-macroglobulin receptor-associated protein isoform X2 [Venturia canescens]|uniref:alpha-2-macroglobulin receptor-associated protein isoform X2 n=1 Tax=Venturia canescens TaxID=32260 RepID=UPI001C9D0729|nr:alpha-2-macroglobulin receptor-associated protein isoform X2 [Venturia canescens]